MIAILVSLLAIVVFLLVRWTARKPPSLRRPHNEGNEDDITIRPA